MQYYRCKCGGSESWTSMGVPECSRCGECGSNHAQSKSTHAPPKPHTYVTRYNERTGAPYELCSCCMQTRDKLRRANEDDGQEPKPQEAPRG